MSPVTEEMRAKAEVYYGQEKFEERSKFMLQEAGLPLGLLPLKDVEECGYVEETGFVWVKQKKKITHKFEKVGRLVTYDSEVTAYVEPNRIRKLHGVKTKELLIWITLAEIFVNDPPTGKLTVKTPQGLTRSFPVAAFELEVAAAKEGEGLKEVKEKKEASEAMEVKAV
ncbi:uncharacterized protein LOC131152941 [Malania oleifera]|uniref:uncharacterized protein LOC131152941 n=1 Tax=Malania oleifera TaxID=397392 RepID=UPI0025ADC48D|nr:uncharacterized protein LOC131152941 [Malania oleifera]